MATTTPNYGWTVPTSTDLVKDGATAIETLGDAIDASMNTALGTKKAGMVLLNTTSFSAVATQSINDVFSATYDNYRIVLTSTTSDGEANVRLRMRVSATDASGSNYVCSVQSLGANGTSYNILSTSATFMDIGRSGQTSQGIMVIDMSRPFIAASTQTVSSSSANGTTTFFKENGAALHTLATSYTGFTILLNSGTITGTVRVYGYNN